MVLPTDPLSGLLHGQSGTILLVELIARSHLPVNALYGVAF